MKNISYNLFLTNLLHFFGKCPSTIILGLIAYPSVIILGLIACPSAIILGLIAYPSAIIIGFFLLILMCHPRICAFYIVSNDLFPKKKTQVGIFILTFNVKSILLTCNEKLRGGGGVYLYHVSWTCHMWFEKYFFKIFDKIKFIMIIQSCLLDMSYVVLYTFLTKSIAF